MLFASCCSRSGHVQLNYRVGGGGFWVEAVPAALLTVEVRLPMRVMFVVAMVSDGAAARVDSLHC
jgi:hypothetical protein